MKPGVLAVHRSENVKIGKASATYASQKTCPKSCPLRRNGCYAEAGPMIGAVQRLNASSESVLATAQREAALIDALPGTRPLRVHVVGDCPSDASARIVGAAMVRYTERSGHGAWTYTHAWRDVDHASWQGASVLASCETEAEVKAARARGYAAALVVVGTLPTEAGRIVRCPSQTQAGLTCAQCKLCMSAGRLYADGITIALEVHGHGARKAAAVVASKTGG